MAGTDRFERGEIVGVELGGPGCDDGRGARDRLAPLVAAGRGGENADFVSALGVADFERGGDAVLVARFWGGVGFCLSIRFSWHME